MLKALFLDLDETLCDTTGANNSALALMSKNAGDIFTGLDADTFAQQYLQGIYRNFDQAQTQRYMPIDNEEAFRHQLIQDLIAQQGYDCDPAAAQRLQLCFDNHRTECFDFFPGIKAKLAQWRQQYTLVVITNGPEFSQLTKVEAVNLTAYVDHIIIGGQEPEQKPAVSIFHKALSLAGCCPHEALHVGDSLAADIKGANDSGIRSLWISHNQPNDGRIIPSHSVESPDQFIEFIDALTEYSS